MIFWALSLLASREGKEGAKRLMKRLVPPAAILYHEPPAEDRPYCILGTDPLSFLRSPRTYAEPD